MAFIELLDKYGSINTSYGTDKNTSHSYGPVYEKIFSPIKDTTETILEIGFDSGTSLKVYSEYFRNALIYGIDIRDNCIPEIKKNLRINMIFGDAKSSEIINYYDKAYDIIVEDASHLLDDQVCHFKDYSDFVKAGGYYIIEDVHENSVSMLVDILEPIGKYKGFSLTIEDLRKHKNRFDDILLVFKKNAV
jgi:trans-aconitate methyltransferase